MGGFNTACEPFESVHSIDEYTYLNTESMALIFQIVIVIIDNWKQQNQSIFLFH